MNWTGGILVVALVLLALSVVSGCATTISNSPTPDIISSPTSLVSRDFKAADRNDDRGKEIGVLDDKDPFSACVKQEMVRLGIEATQPAKSFEPEKVGIITALSIANMEAKKADALLAMLNAGPDPSCDVVFGKVFRTLIRLNIITAKDAASILRFLP